MLLQSPVELQLISVGETGLGYCDPEKCSRPKQSRHIMAYLPVFLGGSFRPAIQILQLHTLCHAAVRFGPLIIDTH